jgi:hypothetical protein
MCSLEYVKPGVGQAEPERAQRLDLVPVVPPVALVGKAVPAGNVTGSRPPGLAVPRRMSAAVAGPPCWQIWNGRQLYQVLTEYLWHYNTI